MTSSTDVSLKLVEKREEKRHTGGEAIVMLHQQVADLLGSKRP
jgi:hypothetical protein